MLPLYNDHNVWHATWTEHKVLKGLWNIARQHDMCKNIIYNYTLLVTNIRLFIRQTKKHTLFNAQIYQINHIGVNMDWEKWGKVRETTFRELTPTSRVRTNASKIPHMISTHAITLYKM